MIQENLKNKDKDLKGMKKALEKMLDRSWEKGYIAGFNDGYATRREADKDVNIDLCETCRYGDTCGQSDKGVSFAKHSKCWKYRYEGGRQ